MLTEPTAVMRWRGRSSSRELELLHYFLREVHARAGAFDAVAILPPSTLYEVRPASAPRIDTENCALYWEVLPMLTETPGSMDARFKKLRPFRGKPSICWRVTTPSRECDFIVDLGATPLHRYHFLGTAYLRMGRFTVVVLPACTVASLCSVRKPCISTRTS